MSHSRKMFLINENLASPISFSLSQRLLTASSTSSHPLTPPHTPSHPLKPPHYPSLPPHYLLKPSSTSPHTLETSSLFIKMGRLPRSEEMRSRKEDSEDEASDDDSADSGSFVVAAAKAANSQQWSTSRRHSDTKKRKKHTNEEGEEWSESQQKKDIIAAFLDPDSGIHTLSIPEIFEEYAADHGWIKSNATSNIRTIKKQYEGKRGPFSEEEVNKTEPFKTRTTKSKAFTLLLKVHMFSEQSGVENMTIEQLHQSQACFRQYSLNDFKTYIQC